MNGAQFDITLEAALSEFPDAQRVNSSRRDVMLDCFIAVAGFEARSIAAAEAVAAAGWRSKRCMLVVYSDPLMRASNSSHIEAMMSCLQVISNGVPPLVVEHSDLAPSSDAGRILTGAFAQCDVALTSATHVAWDISVGSSRLLLEGLHEMFHHSCRLTLLYSESRHYRPLFSEYLEYREHARLNTTGPPEFLTKGVERVEVVRRLAGSNADSRPTFLVLFPSFSFSRSSAIIDELAPSRVQWMFGVPHRVENRWRLDAQLDYHNGLIDASHRRCYVSTFDYKETVEALESIARRRHTDYNVLVASLGSKMQKVGQVLFHLLRPEVGAVVSVPKTWDPDRFSSETSIATYFLDFGNCTRVREILKRTRRLRL